VLSFHRLLTSEFVERSNFKEVTNNYSCEQCICGGEDQTITRTMQTSKSSLLYIGKMMSIVTSQLLGQKRGNESEILTMLDCLESYCRAYRSVTPAITMGIIASLFSFSFLSTPFNQRSTTRCLWFCVESAALSHRSLW